MPARAAAVVVSTARDGLALDDIDWRNGEITVAGKGNRRNRHPLPADAGEAIAAYLQHGRPAGRASHRDQIAGGHRRLPATCCNCPS
jgi:site-specific recombinase XerC